MSDVITGREVKRQLDVLQQNGHAEAREILTRLLELSDSERLLLRARTEAACGAGQGRIRSLWTAWCVSAGAVPGTPIYEENLDDLLSESDSPPDKNYMSIQVKEFYGLG